MADEEDYGSDGEISEGGEQDLSEDSRAESVESEEEEGEGEEVEDLGEVEEAFDDEEEEEEQPKAKKKVREPKQKKSKIKPWVVEKEMKYIVTDPKKAFSDPIISPFEKALLLGIRAKMLDENKDQPALDEEELEELERIGKNDALSIATKEYYLGTLPLYLQREFPDGSVEIWPFKLLKLNPLD